MKSSISSTMIKIKDLCDITSSKRIYASDYQKEGIPFFRGKEIIEKFNGTSELSTKLFIALNKYEEIRRKYGTPKCGDILLTSVGTLGIPFFVKSDDKFYFKDGNLTWFRNFRNLDSLYLYYWLLSPMGKGQLQKCTIGTSQSAYTIVRLKEMDIILPLYSTQKRIASILSAYDDLIENNRRRIHLLEESARLLYREWFVRPRFPGHEHVKIIDGVPEGWEKSILGNNIVLNYGKTLKAGARIEGPYPVYGSSGIVGTHKKPLVKGPGIIVGRKGNVGSVFWSSKDFHPIDTVYYIDTESSDYYLYNALQHMHFVSSDAAVPGLNRNYAYSRLYLLPSENIRSHFENIVAPIYGQIFKLDKYNQKLKRARDLLLPRLMNGEITL